MKSLLPTIALLLCFFSGNSQPISYFQNLTDLSHTNPKKVLSEIGELDYKTLPDSTVGLYFRALGYSYVSLSDYTKALKIYQHNVEEGQRRENRSVEGMGYLGLGVAHYYLGQREIALQYWEEAIDHLDKTRDWYYLGSSYNNAGAVCIELKNLDRAVDYLQKAIAIYTLHVEAGDALLVRLNRLLATAYMDGNHHREAERIFKNLEEQADVSDDTVQMIGVRIFHARNLQVLNQKARYRESILSLKKFIPNCPNLDALQSIYNTLASYYREAGLPDSAYHYLQKFTEVKAEIASKNLEGEIARLETEFKTKQIETEKELLAQKTELQGAELQTAQAKSNVLTLGLLALGVISLLVFSLFWNRHRRKLAEKQHEIAETRLGALTEGKHKERNRLSRELHDNIGSQLSGILLKLDTLSHRSSKMELPLTGKLDEVAENTRGTIHQLRDTIWAMQVSSTTVFDFVQKIRDSAQQTGDSENGPQAVFTIELKGKGTTELAPDQRLNLLRIVQEALHNILKHAEATEVNILFEEKPNSVSVCISDNGKGFSPGTLQSGFGLKNMQERADELKADLEIESRPGQGCTLWLQLPGENKVNAPSAKART